MLPYYESEKLEKILESLFADELDEDIVVLGKIIPIELGPRCCSYNYTGY